ncbi:MAG TPA: hypothetical protein VHO90_04300, partial [Bacteroidales bacterium]|nr:hypothetical protein [Bacteroidales bacterium]
YVLMHDYNFSIQEEQREKIINLCRQVKSMGQKSGEVTSGIDEEELYLVGVSYPIQFINLHLKNFFNQTRLGEDEVRKVLKVQYNLIKTNNEK